MFPAKFERYIEVFGGGGWVLFGRSPNQKCMEVYNDFNSNLACLFSCVKKRTWAFLRELGFLPLNSRDEFNVIRAFLDKQEFDENFLREELELAEHNLSPPEFEEIKAIMLENAEVTDVKRASYGCQPFDVRKCFAAIWQASRRLKDTVVENKDPPYYETEGHYAVVFCKADHARLRDALAASKGKWMVSYNDCEFIRELYAPDTPSPPSPASTIWRSVMTAAVSSRR